jgi:hypothetical protein
VTPGVVQPGDLDKDGRGKLPRHPDDPKQPAQPLVDPLGQPLINPGTGLPITGPGPSFGPLHGPPPCKDGRPREDPNNPGQPLTGPQGGPGFDPHEGRPFPLPTPVDPESRPHPTTADEPYNENP